jgi:diadenosine tetraphosphate (Ap4A) HIT family hydrolase
VVPDLHACHVCILADAPEAPRVLYVDDLWMAVTATDAPGWVMLLARRHSLGWLWEMQDAEAETYGLQLRDISATICAVTRAERVYLMALGENTLHYHCLLIPRFDDTPVDMRGAALLGHASDLADPERAQEITAALRDGLQARRAAPTPVATS